MFNILWDYNYFLTKTYFCFPEGPSRKRSRLEAEPAMFSNVKETKDAHEKKPSLM
ncbi:hypothetical protein AVEN_77258-1, partial [Araneus ventricosus]